MEERARWDGVESEAGWRREPGDTEVRARWYGGESEVGLRRDGGEAEVGWR